MDFVNRRGLMVRASSVCLNFRAGVFLLGRELQGHSAGVIELCFPVLEWLRKKYRN